MSQNDQEIQLICPNFGCEGMPLTECVMNCKIQTLTCLNCMEDFYLIDGDIVRKKEFDESK